MKRDDAAEQPFLIKGVCYAPTPIGSRPIAPLGSQNDEIWGRDLNRLRDMGANAIRVYGMDLNEDAKPFLDASWNHGDRSIFVLLSLWIDPGALANAAAAQTLIGQYRGIAERYGSHPAVLGFCVGAEFNKSADTSARGTGLSEEDYWCRLRNLIGVLHRRVGGKKIVTTALIEDFTPNGFLKRALHHGVHVDAWGFDIYRALSDFEATWADYARCFDGRTVPPLLVNEFGAPASIQRLDGRIEDLPAAGAPGETTMAALTHYLEQAWTVIRSHHCGGFVFEWTDEWWKQDDEHCNRNLNPEIAGRRRSHEMQCVEP